MKITYDKIAQAAYIYFSKAKVVKTVPLNDHTLIDIDKDGEVVGMEILGVSMPYKAFKSNVTRLFKVS